MFTLVPCYPLVSFYTNICLICFFPRSVRLERVYWFSCCLPVSVWLPIQLLFVNRCFWSGRFLPIYLLFVTWCLSDRGIFTDLPVIQDDVRQPQEIARDPQLLDVSELCDIIPNQLLVHPLLKRDRGHMTPRQRSHDTKNIRQKSHDTMNINQKSHDTMNIRQKSHDTKNIRQKSHDTKNIRQKSHDTKNIRQKITRHRTHTSNKGIPDRCHITQDILTRNITPKSYDTRNIQYRTEVREI